jgi:glycosyltransferase involved in cell wall biosynthesis
MRIVIDMQGMQTKSRFRGIGRYACAFVRAVALNSKHHEIVLALNGYFVDSIQPIRKAFAGIVPPENILVWQTVEHEVESTTGYSVAIKVAECMREAFLESLQPDVIHIVSLFEGYDEPAILSLGCFDQHTTVSVTQYDLIPLINANHYLLPKPLYAKHYHRKIQYLGLAQQLLTISEYTRQEALDLLDLPAAKLINVSSAHDAVFKPVRVDDEVAHNLCHRLRINRPFFMAVGAADARKNLTRLIQAYAALPAGLRSRYQLVLVGKMLEEEFDLLNICIQQLGFSQQNIILTGYVTDDDLVKLYNLCEFYVFPSWHEGFGLPALEAMACGAPVITSNTTSLPEVVGLDEAMFDPLSVADITEKMLKMLEDKTFRARVREHGLEQVKHFSWQATAIQAIAAWEGFEKKSPALEPSWQASVIKAQAVCEKLMAKIAMFNPELNEVAQYNIATSWAHNERVIHSFLRHSLLPERLECLEDLQ